MFSKTGRCLLDIEVAQVENLANDKFQTGTVFQKS